MQHRQTDLYRIWLQWWEVGDRHRGWLDGEQTEEHCSTCKQQIDTSIMQYMIHRNDGTSITTAIGDWAL